jgi:hypothetical protein
MSDIPETGRLLCVVYISVCSFLDDILEAGSTVHLSIECRKCNCKPENFG